MNQPDDVAQLWRAAQKHEAADQAAEAEKLYRRILDTDPKFHHAWHALGILAVNAGKLPLAAQLIEKASELDARSELYFRNLVEIWRRLGQLDKAIEAGLRATKIAPNDINAHYNLGLAYSNGGSFDKAIPCYQQALRINPEHGLSWNNLGSALEQRNGPKDKDAAKQAYARAIKINPQHAEAQNNLGAIESEQGLLDAAGKSFEAAILAKPDFVEAHYNYSSLHKYTPNDPHLVHLESIRERYNTLDERARIRYGFSLGKALDDVGDYDRAFAAYAEGNRLQHATLPYDEANAQALATQIISEFNADFFSQRKDWHDARDDKRTPIFIVGMPRSGTTLLEQILCSHPSVFGAGELIDLNGVIVAATESVGGIDGSFVSAASKLKEKDIVGLGNDYLKRVWKLSQKSRFITDKMPANFFYIGLIHLALPHAKIIHAMRDPMDSCFSCYTRLFNDTMAFAYDQGTLGRYYSRYIKLMQHWHAVLPQGTILDLPYESMVVDTEAQARRVLEFVGLPWDANCLNFHENKRLVKTASIAQVRKPIYTSSVARWKHFAAHLRPLYEIVSEFRTTDDGPEIDRIMSTAKVQEFLATGVALYRQGRFRDAVAMYDRALAINPDVSSVLNNKGFALQDQGQVQAAHDCYARAVALEPSAAMPRLNLGLAQLKLGDWEQGWENYESRWSGSAETSKGLERPACPLPQWDGQWDGQGATAQQALLVIIEQGFGDTFQMSRYLPLLTERFARVGFVCSQPVTRLMEWSFGNRIVMMNHLPQDFADWDWQCPLMSLPRAFATRPDTVPADVPYLKIAVPARDYWRRRLQRAAPDRLRVGIAWAGRPSYHYDARRSLAFSQLAPLLADTRVSWICLQKWQVESDKPVLPTQDIDWIDWTTELHDFASTAALVANLDLVISVDSVIVHLAGALAVPVWMLDRFDNEWRWMHQRTDSPWYPQLRVFRQPVFGDWASVIAGVGAALTALPAPRAIHARDAIDAATIVSSAHSQTPAATPQRANAINSAPLANVAQKMQLASQLQNAGRLLDAERLLREIITQPPQNPHALHLLGVVAYRLGKRDEGAQRIADAIAVAPDVALFHSNLAEMYRQRTRLHDSVRHGERAVALDPGLASAFSNLGVTYHDLKDYERARSCHARALALIPTLVQSINNLASIERALKNPEGAINGYLQALQCQPDYVEALSNLGAVLIEEDRADEAAPYLEKAVRLNAQSAEAVCNLGLVRLKQHRLSDAHALISRSLQLRPDYTEGLISLGRCLSELDRIEDALPLLRRAVEIAPERHEAWCHLASLLAELGSPDAEAAYQRTLLLNPTKVDALIGLGSLRLEQGNTQEAVALTERAIEIEPDNVGARFHLTQSKKTCVGDGNVTALETLATNKKIGIARRISLHYALGKVYDDLADYERAFPHFLEGARLKRSQLGYDAAGADAMVNRILEIVDRPFIERLRGAGCDSNVPIFVLGMPRSGTTLTEQIIASHPHVYGAGELRDFMQIVQQPADDTPAAPFPENLVTLTPLTLTRWGNEYINRLRRHTSTHAHITDKMPANYVGLGLIPLMLPHAKIVHVKRNAVDTCVSCFTRLFNRHQEATYDLAELGRHYANYARLMDHWRSVLPAESFIEVQYEDIVADMETQARRLIAYCDLPWDDACLSFYKTQRNIRTASVTQVRQPIYTSSVERWRHYERFLAPLLRELKVQELKVQELKVQELKVQELGADLLGKSGPAQ